MKEWERPVLPRGAKVRSRPLLSEEVECIKIAPDGVHVEFLDGTVKTYRTRDLKFELPEGHVVDVDTMLREYSMEGYVTA